MFESRISRALLALGVAVGLMTVGVWALDVQINPPDWMIRIAMMKLAVLASAGLLAAGALVGRHARARRSLSPDSALAQVGEGAAQPLQQKDGAGAPLPHESRGPDTAT
jgi:hypothetical protein